jgi:hypothetical protein
LIVESASAVLLTAPTAIVTVAGPVDELDVVDDREALEVVAVGLGSVVVISWS